MMLEVNPSPRSASEIQRLVRAAQQGEAWAWYRLVEDHQGLVYGLIRGWNVGDEAEDVFQEVFLKVHKYLHTWRGDSAFSTWLYQVTLNTLRSRAIKRRQDPLREADLGDMDEEESCLDRAPAELPDPVLAMETETRRIQVRQALGALPELHREILVLRDIRELSYEAIGQILRLEPGTVKSRLFRARQALVARLGPQEERACS